MTPKQFLEKTKEIKQYVSITENPDDRFALMYNCLQNLIPGVCVEFGVFQAVTINRASAKRPDYMFYGFDSFEGLPEAWREGHPAGHFNLWGNMPTVNQNVKLIKGWFSDTLDGFLTEVTSDISFLHIDCDIYSSAKFVLDKVAKRLKVGTVILFDELYNYPGWDTNSGFASGEYDEKGAGEFRAWFEFLEKNPNIKFEWIGCNIDSEQVAVKITSI